MVLMKEYRICMPLTTEEYRIGQLYMIARHSHEQSDSNEGVEVVENSVCEDPIHGKGQYTEKRVYLSSKLPYWVQSLVPNIFYMTEKAWNYYPFTITIPLDCPKVACLNITGALTAPKSNTFFCCMLINDMAEYTCSYIPRFSITIKTRYEDNNGSTENCLNLTPIELVQREVDFVDIAYDEISAKNYKEEEDPKFFQSKKTGRGPLVEGWRDTTQPIMCSYKLVKASFEVWGMQTQIEDFIQGRIRDVLLLGHRQAFAWIDEWHGMTLEDVRQYELKMQHETNQKLQTKAPIEENRPTASTPSSEVPPSSNPESPTQSSFRSWFSWS